MATVHAGAYPPVEVAPILAYGFRPFFILLPAYMAMSMLLWGLLWSGLLPLPFPGNPLLWHVYEMVYGMASAGIAGFILTAVPEFYPGVRPVIGRQLALLVLWWLLGRVLFWLVDPVGVLPAALVNVSFLLWVLLLVARPILSDPLRRHSGLAVILVILVLIEVWFFLALGGWTEADPMAVLKVALGGLMVLELLVLRRVNTGVVNEWLEEKRIDALFLARPPRYNVAILCVSLYTVAEYLAPSNPVLGWLGLAAAAAVLNALNDFFLEEETIVFEPWVFSLFLILVVMALGYGALGIDHLLPEVYGINHFRHLLTAGVLGLSFLMVMVIVATVHTGRPLRPDGWIALCIVLLLVATSLRVAIIWFPQHALWLYTASAAIWAAPFIIYLWRFVPWLLRPRVDGLPG